MWKVFVAPVPYSSSPPPTPFCHHWYTFLPDGDLTELHLHANGAFVNWGICSVLKGLIEAYEDFENKGILINPFYYTIFLTRKGIGEKYWCKLDLVSFFYFLLLISFAFSKCCITLLSHNGIVWWNYVEIVQSCHYSLKIKVNPWGWIFIYVVHIPIVIS